MLEFLTWYWRINRQQSVKVSAVFKQTPLRVWIFLFSLCHESSFTVKKTLSLEHVKLQADLIWDQQKLSSLQSVLKPSLTIKRLCLLIQMFEKFQGRLVVTSPQSFGWIMGLFFFFSFFLCFLLKKAFCWFSVHRTPVSALSVTLSSSHLEVETFLLCHNQNSNSLQRCCPRTGIFSEF